MRAVAVAAASLAAAAGAAGAQAPSGTGSPTVRLATTGSHAELVDTIPIARHRRGEPRVAMSLGPRALRPLHRGERLRLNGEVQVTLTCVRPGLPRCIGHTYSYSPRVEARIVLGASEKATGGRTAIPLSTWGGLECGAHLPNRNHHCVLVFPSLTARIGPAADLPCRPARCHVNLVVSADNRHAGHRDRLIIGTDRPNGTVEQDKGRLNAIEIPPGERPAFKRFRTRRLRTRTMPVKEDGGRRVVYSARLPALRRGDVLAVEARQRTDISHLPYAAYISDEILLAGRPRATRPARHSIAAEGGYITEANGFNCTHGPSQYRTPCISAKAGAISIKRTSRGRHGRLRPLYVNLVSRSKPKHADAVPGDVARLRHGGLLSVVRYRR